MSERNPHRLPLRKTAKALIEELGSESNAHGVARIIQSRDKRRKMVWSLLVLLGIGSAVSQLSSLVHKYLQYQVVEVSEIQDGLPVEFPSVTVCNIEPISWRKLRQLLNGNTSNSSSVLAWLHFLEVFDFRSQQSRLRSIRAFHENVGEEVLHVRHSLNESLLHCRFNKQPCSTANFTTSFDGNYYSCFTFNAQPSDPEQRLIVHSTGPEHGLSVVMFLDNNFPPLGSYGVYTLDTNILHSSGARVMVHAPNTLPIPVDHGQDVAPGFSTSVGIKPFLHARLAKPYGNCSDTQLRGLTSFTSTYSTCIAVCKQEMVVRACRCRSSALPQIPALQNQPYCGHVLHWRHMLQHKEGYNRSQHLPTLQCEAQVMDRLKNDRGYEAQCGCSHPCGELSYHMSTSMSYWPTELYQFDALYKLYKEDIFHSPLSRAYNLHHNNIKDGEMLLRQLSQQGQPDNDANISHEDATENGDTQPERKRRHSHGAKFSDSDKRNFRAGKSSKHRNKNRPKRKSAKDTSEKDASGSTESENIADSGAKEQKQPLLEYSNHQLDNLREASTEIRQNLLRLNVYLEDLSVVKYKQMPAYGLEDLFADIGGTLGLWMGVSVLTIMELLELIIRVTHLFMQAEWKPSGSDSKEERRQGRDRDSDCHGRDQNKRDLSDKERDLMLYGDRTRSYGQLTQEARDRPPFYNIYTEYRKDDTHDSDADITEDTTTGMNRRVYSYRNEADYRSDTTYNHHGLFDINGHNTGSPSLVSPQTRTEYSGRTKYWRLKRGKRKK